MLDDWPLVEASFAQQYGIRLEHEQDMGWTEMFNLMTGLLPETPLGQIVSIRAETDPERLKGFNKDQKEIRSNWRSKINKAQVAQMSVEDKKKATSEIQSMLASMFGGGA